MKKLLYFILIIFVISCTNSFNKDNLKDCEDILIEDDSLLQFKNYKESKRIIDIYKEKKSLFNSISSKRIVFSSDIIGRKLQLRDTISHELLNLLKKEHIIEEKIKETSINRLFINRNFKSYLIYILDEVPNENLVIINYKDNNLKSWLIVSNDSPFDDGIRYSFMRNDSIWRIQYDDYGPNDVVVSDSVKINSKKVFYKDFKINDQGYILPID